MPGQRNNILYDIDISDIEFLQDTYRRRYYAGTAEQMDKTKLDELIGKIGSMTDIYYDDDLLAEEKKIRLDKLIKEIPVLFGELGM